VIGDSASGGPRGDAVIPEAVTESADGDGAYITPPPTRRLSAGAFAALVGQLATVAAGVVTSIYVARQFGPGGTGIYALAGNLFAAVILLAALGLPTGVTYLVSRGTWSPRAAFRQAVGAALPMGALGGALGVALYVFFDDSVFDGLDLGEALLVMAVVPLGLAWIVCGSLALAEDRYEQFAATQVSRAVLTVAIVVGLGIEYGLTGAVVGFALAQALAAAFAMALVARSFRRRGSQPTRPHHDRPPGQLRVALRFGRRAWSADVLQFLNYRLDLFMLAAFASRAEVGHYSVAVSLTMLAWLAPAAIGQVLLPRTASLDSATEAGTLGRQEADAAAARVIRHAVILQLPTGVGILVLLLIAIPVIYGDAFHESIDLGLILLPGVLMLSVAKVISPVVTGRGFPQYSLYNVLMCVPVTLALYLILIPTLGAAGAAIASSASYTLTTVVALYFYRRATAGSVRSAIVPTRTDLREYASTASELVTSGRRRLTARGRAPQGRRER
jgi:O-antigen/teichoic acid export membrane protein